MEDNNERVVKKPLKVEELMEELIKRTDELMNKEISLKTWEVESGEFNRHLRAVVEDSGKQKSLTLGLIFQVWQCTYRLIQLPSWDILARNKEVDLIKHLQEIFKERTK